MKSLIPTSRRAFYHVLLLQFCLGVTFAQQPSSTARCQVSTSPVPVRAEGLTERLGDIILQCSGSNPGTVFSGNLTLFLPVSVTNRVDANNLTRDAMVSVDLGGGFVPTAIAGQVSGNGISFSGISYTAPASGNINLKISNVRAAMNQLGYTSTVPAAITASLSTNLAVDQSQLVLAYSQAGMLSSQTDSQISCYGSPMPDTLDLPNLFAAGTAFSSTRVTEAFASAFETRAAGADTGTRFLVKFSGFPATTRLFIPDAVAGSDATQPTSGGDLNLPQAVGQYTPGSGTLVLVRVQNADATGAGGLMVTAPQGSGPVTLSSVSEVFLTGGAGYAVYEVADTNPLVQESAQFPTFIALPRLTPPAVAQETINLAPVSSVATASMTAPVPRFSSVAVQSDCKLFGDCVVPFVAPPKLSLEATPIKLTAVAGGAMTGSGGSILVHNTGSGSMAWTTSVIYSQGSGWVVDTPSGTNEGTVNVTAQAKSLAAGTYQATIIVNGATAGSQSVAVSLTVTAPPAPPAAHHRHGEPGVERRDAASGAAGSGIARHADGLAPIREERVRHVRRYGCDFALLGRYADQPAGSSQPGVEEFHQPGGDRGWREQHAPDRPRCRGVAGRVRSWSAESGQPGEHDVGCGEIGRHLRSSPREFRSSPRSVYRSATEKNLVPVYAGDAPTVPGVQQVNVAVPAGSDELAHA